MLIDVGTKPRDRAYDSTLGKTCMRISESIQLKVTDIDFKRGTLTIVHLKERVKLKCPNCGEVLSKRHLFCPGCGNKVDQATREKVEQRRQRVIPVEPDTLRLPDEYLQWRRKFPYRGPLVFPFTRQRGWQLIERTDKREPAIYDFLQKRVFYRLTDEGKAEVSAWEDPITAVHPEFR